MLSVRVGVGQPRVDLGQARHRGVLIVEVAVVGQRPVCTRNIAHSCRAVDGRAAVRVSNRNLSLRMRGVCCCSGLILSEMRRLPAIV